MAKDRLQAAADYMSKASQEVRDAMEARVGIRGREYTNIVRECAGSCAAMKAAILAMKSPVAEKALAHAAECTIAFDMQKVMALFQTTDTDDPRVKNFVQDVLTLTSFMFKVVE